MRRAAEVNMNVPLGSVESVDKTRCIKALYHFNVNCSDVHACEDFGPPLVPLVCQIEIIHWPNTSRPTVCLCMVMYGIF